MANINKSILPPFFSLPSGRRKMAIEKRNVDINLRPSAKDLFSFLNAGTLRRKGEYFFQDRSVTLSLTLFNATDCHWILDQSNEEIFSSFSSLSSVSIDTSCNSLCNKKKHTWKWSDDIENDIFTTYRLIASNLSK